MQTRNKQRFALQRSKSLPSRYPKQSLMFGSKSTPNYKQQMRMVSLQSKNKQEPKSQTDIPAVQKALDEFEHILKNLQMTNSDISDLNVLMKDLRDRISHFPRFLPANPEQKVAFFEAWNNLKQQAIKILESGQSNGYEPVFQQFNEANAILKEMQSKSRTEQKIRIVNNLIEKVAGIEKSIKELDQNKKDESYDQKKLHNQVVKIKNDLLKLQSNAPTTKIIQSIARILLEFNKIEKKEKSLQILNYNIEKTEKKLQALIQIKQQPEQSSIEKDRKAPSTITNRKRTKSVGAFDVKSRASKVSRVSSKSSISERLNNYDCKIKTIKSQSLNLNYEINKLNIKITKIQKSISTYQTQLDQLVEYNSIERDGYRKKVAEKIKKSGVPGWENYEQKEKHLATERKNNYDFRLRLKELDKEENERLELNDKIRETQSWQAQIDEELKRAKNIYNRLKAITSEENLNGEAAIENGGMEISVDNNELLKEKLAFEKSLKDKKDSINNWCESWRQSVGDNIINDFENVPQSDIRLMYKRSEFDSNYIANWTKELKAQIGKLKKEVGYLEESDHKSDSLAECKKAFDKLSFYYSTITNAKNKEKVSVLKQIHINKMEINRLSKLENEAKSESQEIEDQRNQNRQMIEWVKELIDQIQSAMTSQSGLKAQYESLNTTVFRNNDDDNPQLKNNVVKKEDLEKEIKELSEAIFKKYQKKFEYEDNNTNMQQLYENMFYVQTNDSFMHLCPQVKNRIKKLIKYYSLKRKYNHLINPDAEDSDISIGFDADDDNIYDNDDNDNNDDDNNDDSYYPTENSDNDKNDDNDNNDDDNNDDSYYPTENSDNDKNDDIIYTDYSNVYDEE